MQKAHKTLCRLSPWFLIHGYIADIAMYLTNKVWNQYEPVWFMDLEMRTLYVLPCVAQTEPCTDKANLTWPGELEWSTVN